MRLLSPLGERIYLIDQERKIFLSVTDEDTPSSGCFALSCISQVPDRQRPCDLRLDEL